MSDDTDVDDELQRLRDAIVHIANVLGPNVISAKDAERLIELLTPPEERDERRPI